jgi:hypothetical protein
MDCLNFIVDFLIYFTNVYLDALISQYINLNFSFIGGSHESTLSEDLEALLFVTVPPIELLDYKVYPGPDHCPALYCIPSPAHSHDLRN